ncbi:hypothetical protein [Raoultella planticola]|uniref:hypothetical protein n=1 Tax=Raoultella planticola TaxID=575 RepID=UPI0010342FFE|nr:hypothetical protein [Raoultella planticola]MBZ7832113.1 hypothetical protein [Raoultella planticola]UNK76638.1 hypothetical protein MNO12_08840 [Raoultella planticola]HDG9773715.1 hypothetical protein [Raoultella planticola]
MALRLPGLQAYSPVALRLPRLQAYSPVALRLPGLQSYSPVALRLPRLQAYSPVVLRLPGLQAYRHRRTFSPAKAFDYFASQEATSFQLPRKIIFSAFLLS